MKRILILFIVLATSTVVFGEKLFFYTGKMKVYLQAYPNMISVIWRDNVETDDKARILNSLNNSKFLFNVERYNLTVLKVEASKALLLLNTLQTLPEVEFAQYALRTKQGISCFLTNRIIVKFDSSFAMTNFEKFHNLELYWENPYDKFFKIYKVKEPG